MYRYMHNRFVSQFLPVLRTAGEFGAQQKMKCCAAKQQMLRSKCSSDGWGKDQ